MVPLSTHVAAGELWEKSGLATGNPADPYVPGAVALPEEAGRIVQLSAGVPGDARGWVKQAGHFPLRCLLPPVQRAPAGCT